VLTGLTTLLTLSTFFQVTRGLFFAFVLLNGALQAAAGAYLQTSVIAVASLFGPLPVQAMMSGQAAVSVVVSGVQVLSAAAFLGRQSGESVASFDIALASAEEQTASTFFAFSTFFLILCVAAHAWLVRLPIYKSVAAPLEQHKNISNSTSGARNPSSNGNATILRLAKANLTYEVAVAYVFVVTIVSELFSTCKRLTNLPWLLKAVFPPITNSIQPANPNIHPLLFSAIHFLVFGIGDLAGRYLCIFPRLLVWSANRLLTMSISRTLFIMLFLMCNVQRPSSSVHSYTIINSDVLYMLILLAFGMSNGYVTSMCMISVSSLEHNPHLKGRREDVDVAATVATFCLVGGIVGGSLASFAVRAAVCECNPFTM
jgi:equilibrative nucleoside transporter 1/2/3